MTSVADGEAVRMKKSDNKSESEYESAINSENKSESEDDEKLTIGTSVAGGEAVTERVHLTHHFHQFPFQQS